MNNLPTETISSIADAETRLSGELIPTGMMQWARRRDAKPAPHTVVVWMGGRTYGVLQQAWRAAEGGALHWIDVPTAEIDQSAHGVAP